MDKALIAHLQKLDGVLAEVQGDLKTRYPGKTPDFALAQPRFPQPGGESDWQSCIGAGVTAGAAHYIGCVIEGQRPGESADGMMDRCKDEAETAALLGQLRCWIGKKIGGGVFQ